MQPVTMDPFRNSASKELRLTQTASVLMKSRDVVNRLENAFQPYVLQLVPSFEGIRLSGGNLVVTLAEKVIERLTTALGNNAHFEPLFVEDAVQGVVEHGLRYDLAFRLDGVPYPVRPLSLGQVAFLNLILHGVTR